MTQDRIKELLERHIERIEREISNRRKRDNTYSRVRITYFLIALCAVIFSYDNLPDVWYVLSLTAWVAGFLVILHLHRKVYQSLEKFEHLKSIKREHIARMNLSWDEIRYRNTELDLKNHPFAHDFNIPGKHSLFHLLDTSIYPGGGERLLGWLTTYKPQKEQIANRQALVQELSPLMGFRDKLRVINLFTTMHVSEKDWKLEDMLNWLRTPQRTGFKTPLLILSGFSVFNITMLVLIFSSGVSSLFLVGGLLSYMLVYKSQDKKIMGLFNSAFNMEKILNRFEASLLHVERFRLTNKPHLRELLSAFHNEGEEPSKFVKKVQKLMNRAALQANQILWGIVNITIPWDLYHSWKVEQLKVEFEQKFSAWTDLFYELEALNALATFSQLNPGYTWPVFSNDKEVFLKADQLGHPLIPASQKVSNNFEVRSGKDLFLITGSNMAGKSTFLRTVGINLALAHSGAPVDAKTFQTKYVRLFSSININDSLDDGLSHFYAEVKRLRALLTELESEHEFPLFFFVDEIYKGTNNRERYAGSAAFLKEVAGKRGVGMISSHDLELADLENEVPQLSNWHFSETISDGKMSFEYKLQPGPCPSTNALQIMKMEGLPVK
jgi:hypothetical protein